MHRLYATSAALVLALTSATAAAEEPRPAAPTPAPTPTAERAGARPLSLRDALERFRRQNLELAAARFDVSAARADALGAGLYPNPSVAASGAFLAHGVPSGGQQELYVSVTQTAPLAGQVGLRREAAQGFASAAEREFAATAWQLTCDVRLAYLELQLAQEQHRASATAAQDLDRVLAIIAERVSAGANPAYDRVRVGVERSAVVAQQTESEISMYNARVALGRSIGKDVDAMGLVAEPLGAEPTDTRVGLGAAIAAALLRRAEVAAGRARVSANDLRTAAARRSGVPSPDLSLGYAHFFRIPGDSGARDGGAVTAGISVPLPLFDRA